MKSSPPKFEDLKRGTLWRDRGDGQIFQVVSAYEKLFESHDHTRYVYKKFIEAIATTSKGAYLAGATMIVRWERAREMWERIYA